MSTEVGIRLKLDAPHQLACMHAPLAQLFWSNLEWNHPPLFKRHDVSNMNMNAQTPITDGRSEELMQNLNSMTRDVFLSNSKGLWNLRFDAKGEKADKYRKAIFQDGNRRRQREVQLLEMNARLPLILSKYFFWTYVKKVLPLLAYGKVNGSNNSLEIKPQIANKYSGIGFHRLIS